MNIAYFKKLPGHVRFFMAVVILPTLIAAIYYGLVASDIYISEAKYAIRTNAETASTGLVDSLLATSVGGITSANEDAQIVKDYTLSLSMLEELNERLSIFDHYSSHDIDYFSRMNKDATMEEFLKYFRKKISVSIDAGANITTLQVRAFTPEMAREIAQTIIKISETLVNHISDRLIKDFLQFARNEVVYAEDRVKATSQSLTDFRSKNRSINPGEETSAVLGIVTELETRLAAARTELIEARNFLHKDSTQIKVLENKVAALEKQVLEERTRLASDETGESDYTQLIDKYEPLILEQQLAREFYTSALSSLEIARTEAQRKQRYLISFVEPRAPGEALEPERLYIIGQVLALLLLIYAIGSLVFAAIKDHLRI